MKNPMSVVALADTVAAADLVEACKYDFASDEVVHVASVLKALAIAPALQTPSALKSRLNFVP